MKILRYPTLILAVCSFATSVRSQIVWDGLGSDDNWSTGNNWLGNAAPSNDGSADVVFSGTTRTTPNVNTAWSVSSLSFDNSAAAFTISGSTISPPAGAPFIPADFIVNNSLNPQTINNNIGPIDNLIINAGSDQLIFNGNIATTGGGLVTTGPADITVNGNITSDGFLNKDGDGSLILNGSNNSFSQNTFVNAGTLQVNGAITGSPTVNIFAGATVSGNGSISGELAIGNAGVPAAFNGTVSPGTGIGKLTAGSMTWNVSGHYNWEINKAAGTAGSDPGHDLLAVTGGLTINATASDRFTVHVISLSLGGLPGAVGDFNSGQNQSWHIVTTGSGITGFDSSKFSLDTSEFQNVLNGGSFSLSVNGNDLDLNFTAVPEPAAYGLAMALGLAGFTLARRARRSH